MISINGWNDLQKYGIEWLTGEACGLGYRILCDVNKNGKHVLEKCLGVPNIELAENWNTRSSIGEHIGSIMLAPDMLKPLAIFALLEYGCREVLFDEESGSVYGVEARDTPECVEEWKSIHAGWHKEGEPRKSMRRYAYAGTAGDRNVHMMSGRVE
jgi:hypothetical protein